MSNSYRRTLVLHADDFGMNAPVNAGIVRAFEQGLLTSTSVLANSPAAADALRIWPQLERRRQSGSIASSMARRLLEDAPRPFDLGVHLNLTQGRPLTAMYPAELLDSRGLFPGVFGLFARLAWNRRRHQAALRRELEEQIAFVRDHGVEPTHINGHQYVEMFPVVAGLLPGLMKRFGIAVARLPRERPGAFPAHPWRWPDWGLAKVKQYYAVQLGRILDRCDVPHPDVFHGASHAGRVDLDVMTQFVGHMHCGHTEIALHSGCMNPAGSKDADGWADPLAALRPQELAMLTSDALLALLEREQIRLGRLTELAVGDAVPLLAA